MAPRLVIVTLNWNGAEETLRCIESVASDRTSDVELVVVDNGSREADVARVATSVAELAWATLVRNDRNLGFTGGSNVGIRVALEREARFVMLLNNDATLEPGALRTLLEHMEAQPSTGLAAPLVVDESGERVWAAGGVYARREVVCRLGASNADAGSVGAEPFEAWALVGCALVARRELLDEIGLLDEDYFAYVEDVDLSRRASAEGWRLHVVPAARVRHRVSASSGGGYTPLRSYLLGRGTALFVRRRGTAGQRLGFAVAAPLGLAAAAIREARRGNLGAVAAKARGYVDGLLARPVDERYFPPAK
jgi:GT2 family glycosyltransferase